MILLIYVLKLFTCSALFYGYYFLFLRNKQMHQYNRFYILISTVLSIVLPLIRLPLLPADNEVQAITKTLGIAFGGWENEIVITAKQSILYVFITEQHIFLIIYLTGFLAAMYPLIKSLLYIRKMSLKHTATELHHTNFYNTAEPGTPFSFFNSVYWNSSISLETEEGRHILRHELYHIHQKHSYDILFMQVVCSLLWFNPFCYLINKELKAIHEFLADEYAALGSDRHHYAELLVMQTVSPKQLFISNQFFYNQIKRRITMVLQNNNTRYNQIRKAMAVPLVLLIFCACSVKSKDDENFLQLKHVELVKPMTKKDSMAISQYLQDKIRSLQGKKEVDKTFTKVEVESSFPGGNSGWIGYLSKNFRYPQEAQDREIQGPTVIQFIVEKDGTLSDIHAISGPEILAEEAVRIIAQSGKWIPAQQNGHIVRSYKKQPITFKLEAE